MKTLKYVGSFAEIEIPGLGVVKRDSPFAVSDDIASGLLIEGSDFLEIAPAAAQEE